MIEVLDMETKKMEATQLQGQRHEAHAKEIGDSR